MHRHFCLKKNWRKVSDFDSYLISLNNKNVVSRFSNEQASIFFSKTKDGKPHWHKMHSNHAKQNKAITRI